MPFCFKLYTAVRLGLAATALLVPCSSFASTITVSFGGTTLAGAGQVSSLPGVTTVNFDSGTAPAYYTITPNAEITSGNSGGIYAAPTNDTTNYLSSGTSNVSINPVSPSNYFGLYWGSVDGYNTLSFTAADGSMFSYTGTQIATMAGIPSDGTTSAYVNFALTGSTFSNITLSSSQFAFESDNHAFANTASATPEPATWAMIVGGIGLIAVRGRRKSADQE